MGLHCFAGPPFHSLLRGSRCPWVTLCALCLAGFLVMSGCAGAAHAENPTESLERAQQEHRARLADADSAYRMGVTALSAGELERAERRFQEATELNPYHGAAHNDLGVVHFRRGDLYQAAVAFDTAAKNLVDRHEPFFNLGMVLEKGGLLREAMEAYRNALRLAPEDLPTIRALVRTRAKLGEGGAQTARLIERALLQEQNPQWRRWLRLQRLRLRGMEPVETNSGAEPEPDVSDSPELSGEE